MTDSGRTPDGDRDKPQSLMGFIGSNPPDGSKFSIGEASFIRRNGKWIDEKTGKAIQEIS